MIIIRPFEYYDIPQLIKCGDNPNVAKYLYDNFPQPYQEKDAAELVYSSRLYSPTRQFAIQYDNKCVGYIGIHQDGDMTRMNAEIGYWIGEEYWHKGIATHAIKLMVEHVQKNLPEIKRIYARVISDNFFSKAALHHNEFIHFYNLYGLIVKGDNNLHDESMWHLYIDSLGDLHNCNEDAQMGQTSDGRRYYYDVISQEEQYKHNFTSSSVCCSICGNAAIDNFNPFMMP